jgi:ribose-phosphate pyrophosphokinase
LSVLFSLHGSERLTGALCSALTDQKNVSPEIGKVTTRRFPDDETYVRVDTSLQDRSAIIVCSLDRPDQKILPLIFLAETARDMGAKKVGLIAPYLPYMRQDKQFQTGEGITSTYFAQILSNAFEWLVTVDPHLHRRSSLSELYTIDTQVVHAAPRVAEWIRLAVTQPLLVGPDAESEQWVAAVAQAAGAPYVVLEKVRSGDREVAVSVPDVERWADHTPVLVDDIVSTARTMIETIKHLSRAGLKKPVCVAVHAIFAGNAYEDLLSAGAAKIVSCNTVVHQSNAIDMTNDLATAVRAVSP